MKYLVKVTQECIDNGSPRNPSCCPIAWAMNSLGFSSFGVTNHYIRIEENEDSKYVSIPEIVTNFVNDFDNDNPVEPFEFELDTDKLNPLFHKKA